MMVLVPVGILWFLGIITVRLLRKQLTRIPRSRYHVFVTTRKAHIAEKKKKSRLDPLASRIVFELRRISDLWYTLLLRRGKSKRSLESYRKLVQSLIDGYILFLFIGLAILVFSGYTGWIVTGLLIWRLASILLAKIDELFFLKSQKPAMEAFSRTMIFVFINLAEISLAYAYFYSHPDIAVFSGDRIQVLGKTMQVFVSWGIAGVELCTGQTLIMLSQIMFALVFLMFFVGNISSFRYEEQNDKR